MSTSNVVTLQQPAPAARFLVMDLETGNPDQACIDAAIEAWKPPANVKDPEKIEARRIEARAKIAEKGALLDAAPVLCVAIKTDTSAIVFNGMGDPGPLEIPGWGVLSFDTERAMLEALSLYMGTFTGPETTLVGHNIQSFDAPKLRSAFVRHRLPLPQCLKPIEPYQPMWDTMRKFRFYSAEHSDALFVSLDTIATAFGIPRAKDVVSGAEVPKMHQEGRYAEILAYNAIDVEVTTEIYKAMTL